MKRKQVILCALVMIMAIALALPVLAQENGNRQSSNAGKAGEVVVVQHNMSPRIDPIYLIFLQSILMKDNEMVQEIITLHEGKEEYLLNTLLYSHTLYPDDDLPPLLTAAMLVGNAEAFDLMYKSIPGASKPFALQEAFAKFLNDEGKMRESNLAMAIQYNDVANFMLYYSDAEENGTIIEELTKALAEFQEDEAIKMISK